MPSTTITVSTTKALYAALAKASGGETILLEGGNYGAFSLTPHSGFNLDFLKTVTIKSKDAGDPAVFSRADVRNADNLAFDGIKFDYTFVKGQVISERPFNFTGCENLTIRNSTFDGDVASGLGPKADGYGYAFGLSVMRSNGITIENNEFYNFYRGLVTTENSSIVVRGNEVRDMRMDGITFSQTKGVLIEDNYIHDFRGSPTSGDHSDMIQFWTASTTKPTTGVIIRGNLLDIGDGTPTQSIFMRNELVDTGRAGRSMYYDNVLIEDNTIINAHAHGITVGEAAGLTVRNNSVLHADGGNDDAGDRAVEIPRINIASRSINVSITDNVTAGITGHAKQATWKVAENALVQDQNPHAANHYSTQFVASSLEPEGGRHEYFALEGSAIDRLDAGSTMTRVEGPGLSAKFHMVKADAATRVFDANASLLNNGDIPAGAVCTWVFGDGTTATGRKVSHSFADGGNYDVTLKVKLPDGRTATENLAVSVDSPELVTMRSDGRFTYYHGGETIESASVASASTAGLQLGAKGVAASVGRSHVVDVVGSKDMTIAFSLDADTAGTSGEVFRLQGSFHATVSSTGELQFRLTQQGGSDVVLNTKGARLNSGVERDVVVQLEDGLLQVWVDGALTGKAAARLPVGGASGFDSQSLLFGNPWGRPNFNGDLKAFEVAVGAGDFPARPTTVVLDSAAARTTVATTFAAPVEDVAVETASDAEDRFEFASAGQQDAVLV